MDDCLSATIDARIRRSIPLLAALVAANCGRGAWQIGIPVGLSEGLAAHTLLSTKIVHHLQSRTTKFTTGLHHRQH